VKGTTIALIVGALAVVGVGGYFIYRSHQKAEAAAAAAKAAAAGSHPSSSAQAAQKILSMVPSAVSLGKQIAGLF